MSINISMKEKIQNCLQGFDIVTGDLIKWGRQWDYPNPVAIKTLIMTWPLSEALLYWNMQVEAWEVLLHYIVNTNTAIN